MSWAELVAEAERIRGAVAVVEPRLAALPVAGIAWATVDAERAFAELDELVGGAAHWGVEERDDLLGASAWRRDPPPAGGPEVYVVEPDTEGRLAAFLARFGEGVGAVSLASADEFADRIVPVHRRWGPYAIIRGRAGCPAAIEA